MAVRELASRLLHSLPSPALSRLLCSVHLCARHRHQPVLELQDSFRSSQGGALALLPAHREPHVSTRVLSHTHHPTPATGAPSFRGAAWEPLRAVTCPTAQQGPSCSFNPLLFFKWAAECISLSVKCLQTEPHVFPHEGSCPWNPRMGEVSEALQGPLHHVQLSGGLTVCPKCHFRDSLSTGFSIFCSLNPVVFSFLCSKEQV